MIDMEEDIQVLIGRLSGLEAARKAIEAEIADIHRRISTRLGQMAVPTAPREEAVVAASEDPTILGRDTLGRIKRKRNISPELRERKRELIAAARAARLDKLHTLRITVVDQAEPGKADPQ